MHTHGMNETINGMCILISLSEFSTVFLMECKSLCIISRDNVYYYPSLSSKLTCTILTQNLLKTLSDRQHIQIKV